MTTSTYYLPATTTGGFTEEAAANAVGKYMSVSMSGHVVARGRVITATADDGGNLTLEVTDATVQP